MNESKVLFTKTKLADSPVWLMRSYQTRYMSLILPFVFLAVSFNVEVYMNTFLFYLFLCLSFLWGVYLIVMKAPTDKVTIDTDNLILKRYGKKALIIPVKTIESLSSSSQMAITLTTGEQIDVNYASWMMNTKEVREFSAVLHNLVNG